MRLIITCLAVILCAHLGYAQEMMLKHTGGFIMKPVSGATIRVLNTQEKVDLDQIKITTDRITDIIGLPFTFVYKKTDSRAGQVL